MTEKKNILIDFEKIKDPYSGLGQFCAHLKKYFVKNKELDIDFWVPNKWERLAKHFPFLLPSCDLFHATHQDSPYIPWSKKTKYILTIHDLNALYESNDLDFHKKYKKQLQEKINRANIITFISNFTKTEVEKNFKIPASKSLVIYNGISLGEKVEKPKKIPTMPFIYSVGTVLPKKNFHVLIEFLKLVPNFQLYISGTTYHAYAKQIQKKIEDEGLKDRFVLTGTISEAEKRWYYNHASAFIFPSLLEGFGLPVAEAMSLGLPLFLSEKSSLPEIGGLDAYYFKSFEPAHMRDVFLKGMSEFNDMKKQNLIERSKLFQWEKASNDYLTLYKSL